MGHSRILIFAAMASVRLEKVSALIKREMSTIFQQNMSVLFKGTMISVTNVRVSPDLGVSKIYLSFFPVEQRESGMIEVKAHAVHLRRLLGDKVGKQLRKIPELQFFLDDSLDYYEEIDRLLKKK